MKSGLILFNKKPGITSFDALRDIKRALGTGKVGHTGTLDKFASGLLAVLAGRALKLSRWFSHCDKKYLGRIRFGVETDTLDPEGKITAEAALPSREEVESVLSLFTGEILQEPPVFSAIHINGKRSSDLARLGCAPQMKKRPVSVYKLEILSWQPPLADIFVHCSSGTYIRSLTRDIALAAGSRAHLCGLERTQVAGFCLNFDPAESQRRGERKEEWEEIKSNEFSLIPIDKTVISNLGMPWFEISAKEAENIIHGKPLDPILKDKFLFSSAISARLCETSCKDQAAGLFCEEALIAVVEKDENNWRYGCVY